MTVFALGRINVPTPGQPVALAASKSYCNRIQLEMPSAVTHTGVVLKSAATGNVIHEFKASLSPSDSWTVMSQDGTNVLDLSQYEIDVGTAGDGLYVTYWTN